MSRDIGTVVKNAQALIGKGAQESDVAEYLDAEGYTEADVADHLNREKLRGSPLGNVGNTLRQVSQGALMGFGDEIASGLSAAVEAPFSDKTMGEIYDQRLQENRAQDSAFQQLYPKTSLAANVAGAIPAAIATGGQSVPASVGSAVGRGVLQGGAFGALTGFGNAEGGIENRLTDGATGMAGGAVLGGALSGGAAKLSPYVARLFQSVTGNSRLFNPTTLQLTDQGRRALQQAGVSAEQMTDDAVAEFARMARTAASPEQVGRAAQARTLPVPVQLTRGQISGQPGQQMTESMMAADVYGPAAGGVMRSAEAAQQAALRANIPAIQGRIAGQHPQSGPGQGATTAQRALIDQRTALEGNVRAGYDAARASTGGFDAAAVDDLGAALSQRLTGKFTPGTVPKAEQVLADYGRLTNVTRGGVGSGTQGQGPSTVLIKSMFDWRQRANRTLQSADQTETAAIRGMITRFDDWIENSVDDALFSGNPESIAAWRAAINSRRELGGRFQGGDLVAKLTERISRGGETVLKVAPEDAANFIFGASNTGWATKSNLARDLTRIRELLGPQSGGWNGIRQEAFLRLARSAEGAFEGGERQLSGSSFAKAWQTMQRDNPELVYLLFNESERRLITQFSNVASVATNPVRGGRNTSGTAAALANIGKNLATTFGGRVAAFVANSPLMKSIAAPVNVVRAANMAQGVPERAIPGWPGKVGAGAAGQSGEPIDWLLNSGR